MKRYTESAIILLAVLALVGCSKADEFKYNPDSALQIESVSGISPFALMQEPATKAVITGNTLTGSDAATGVGLFVTASNGGAYDGHDSGYTNVKYTFDGSKWNTQSPIYLSNNDGKLYGYFPYNPDATGLHAIPVESSLNGTDYLYAEPQEVSFGKPVTIQMKHALARLHLTIVKGENYKGSGTLSGITLTSTAIGATGTLDLTDGTVAAQKGAGSMGVVPLTADGTIDKTGLTKDILLVTGNRTAVSSDLAISLAIDGTVAGVSLSSDNGVVICQGVQYNLTLTVEDTGIKVTGVDVGVWGDGGSQTVQVQGHTVTVKFSSNTEDKGIVDDVLTNLKADGNSVIIRALSYAGKHLKCTLTGDEFCPQSKNANMAYTFTLSDIASEITATIGYAKEVTITKFVTPEGSGTINVTGDCYEGETVTLTAIEDYDYYSFVEWQDAGGEKLDWTDSQDITLTSDHLTVKAIYRNNSVLPGIFTVNESDKKVQFSKGNLYFNGGYDGSNKYCLEKKQYDIPPLTIKNDLMNETESHVGHFYWSSNAERARSLSYYSDADASYEGDEFFANHPDSFEVNRLKGWSVLTGNPGGEWEYLLNTRKTIYGTGILSENNRRYAAVKVNSINGLLIFPDEFSWPAGAGDEPQTFNTFSNDWNGLNYTETQFAALQTAGCVFLPAAGYRDGNSQRSDNMSVNQPVALGCYWSASPISYYLANALVFQKDEVSLFGPSRYYAYAVRLVTEVK